MISFKLVEQLTLKTMKSLLLTLTISLLSLLSCSADIKAYIKFTGGNAAAVATGDSTDSQYPGSQGWFKVDSYSLGIKNTINIGGASSGSGSGRASFEPVKISKTAGRGSAQLLLACATGRHYDQVTLVVVRSSDSGGGVTTTRVLQMDMHLVLVESIQTEGTNGDDATLEEIVIKHGAQKVEFFRQKMDGSEESAGSSEWSVVLNEATTNVQ